MNTPKDALVISAVGLVTTVVTGAVILRAVMALRWPHTPGTMLESEIGEIEGGEGKLRYELRVRYSYSVGGQEFDCDRLSFFGRTAKYATRSLAAAHRNRIRRGQQIDVWYNPADPAQAVNDRRIPWGLWFVFAFGLIFLLGGALPLLLGRLKG